MMQKNSSLLEIAKIQSTKASNKIEGIWTSDERLEAIVKDKSQPRNRSEEEISGYRDVLSCNYLLTNIVYPGKF